MPKDETGRRLDPKWGTLVVPEGGLFTTSMVAKVCGCDPQLVRKWARRYRMGQRMARDLFFSESDVALFLSRRRPGRPKKTEAGDSHARQLIRATATLTTMTPTKARLSRWDDIPREPVKPGIDRRLVTTERMMLAHVYIDKDAIVPWHSHENEQLTYILEGALQFTLGDKSGPESEMQTITVHAGEVLHIPSQLPHRAVALEDTMDVDIFCPPRADWLDGTDTYFHDES